MVYPAPTKSSVGLFSAIYSTAQKFPSEDQCANFPVPITVQAGVRTDFSVAEGASFAGIVLAEGGVHTLLLLIAR